MQMLKRWLILVLLAFSGLVMACTPTVDEAVEVDGNGRLVTVFASPT